MSTLPWHQAILVAVIIIALAIGFVAWLRVLFFQWKTISNRREGVRLFRDAPLRNPANILFRGELLTLKRLAYRRKMGQSLVLFFIAGFAVALVFGLAWLALR